MIEPGLPDRILLAVRRTPMTIGEVCRQTESGLGHVLRALQALIVEGRVTIDAATGNDGAIVQVVEDAVEVTLAEQAWGANLPDRVAGDGKESGT